MGKIIRIDMPQLHSMFRMATGFTEIEDQEKEMINTFSLIFVTNKKGILN